MAMFGQTQSADENCPVCKSTRYMNPDMKFVLNPECYHRMCLSCADRIFAAGRAKCPIAKCSKMLRRGGFREQKFDDVKMEREKDIREEVAAVFNRREDEFENLRAYNDYLEEVEIISFGLINGIDLEENKRKLQHYKDANRAEIAANKAAEQVANEDWTAAQVYEREQTKLKRDAVKRESEEARRELEQDRRRIVNDIASSTGDAAAIAKKGAERLHRNRLAHDQSTLQANPVTFGDSFTIRGLRKRVQPEPEKPYDPFGGLQFHLRYTSFSDDYTTDWLLAAHNDIHISTGGYDLPDYCTLSLRNVFAGLSVLVGDEKVT